MIDGVTEIRTGVAIGPFVSIGLVSGNILGPTIEEDVMVGASASVLGKITVGRGATIGANAAVLRDVPRGRHCNRGSRSTREMTNLTRRDFPVPQTDRDG